MREKLFDPSGRVLVNTGENVREIGDRLDVIS
jgi:hypothetical protein